MTFALNYTTEMVSAGECWSCGVPIYLPQNKYRSCKDNGHNFYCCNGHSATFTETEVKRLTRELAAVERSRDAQKARADMAERSAKAYKGKVTEIKNRVGNGVCPCCKRTFKQLARHMACKHPDYAEDGRERKPEKHK